MILVAQHCRPETTGSHIVGEFMTLAGIGKEDKKIKLVKDVSIFRKFSFWRKFWGEVNEELSYMKRVFGD